MVFLGAGPPAQKRLPDYSTPRLILVAGGDSQYYKRQLIFPLG